MDGSDHPVIWAIKINSGLSLQAAEKSWNDKPSQENQLGTPQERERLEMEENVIEYSDCHR